MKTEKTPDRFVILHHIKENTYAIFSGWSGGYLSSDSWNRSSKIQNVKDIGDYIEAETETSIYHLRKTSLGYTGYMLHILSAAKQSDEFSTNIDIIDDEEKFKKFLEIFLDNPN